jgi:hypothetical protein
LLNSWIFLGILIFERVNTHIKFNLIHAIFKCSLDTSPTSLISIPLCTTLQDACSIIQTNHELKQLRDILVANIKSYFHCNSCNGTSDSLLSLKNQIFVFKLTANNQIIAYPIVSDNRTANDIERICSNCDYSTKNIETKVHKQIFIKCPSILIVRLFTLSFSHFI